MEQLVPIGRFSKMTRLSVKALRHYDDLGLLRPAEVDPSSGYRYYALTQARDAEAIRLLRSLDMPLDEIAEALGARDDQALVTKVLDRHRDRLADAVAAQQRRLGIVERLINTEEPLVTYTVETKSVPDVPVVGLRQTTDLTGIGETFAKGFPALYHAVIGTGTQPTGMPFAIYHDVIDADTSGDVEMVIPVADGFDAALPDDAMAARTLPAGTVAFTVHRGAYSDVAPAYHVLTGWVQEHGHEVAGPPREIYLNDPSTVPEDELLTEVQFPIA